MGTGWAIGMDAHYFEPGRATVIPEANWRYLEFNFGRCGDHWQLEPDVAPRITTPKSAQADLAPASRPHGRSAERQDGADSPSSDRRKPRDGGTIEEAPQEALASLRPESSR